MLPLLLLAAAALVAEQPAASALPSARPSHQNAPTPYEPPERIRIDEPAALFRAALDDHCATTSTAQLNASLQLLLTLCQKITDTPTDAKFRSARAKALARLSSPSGLECLATLGFACADAAADDARFTLCWPGEPVMLRSAVLVVRRALRVLELRRSWPSTLHEQLPEICRNLEGAPELLGVLSSELSAPHMPRLLEVSDNLARVRKALSAKSRVVTATLVDQLREARENITAASGDAAAASAGESRVIPIKSNGQWYDLLMDTGDKLLVADFSASWCGPCQMLKPLFDELSREPRYADKVIFASLDADEVPVLMGENLVDRYPTIKFFRHACEDDEPMTGANLAGLVARIDRLLGTD